MRTCSQATPFRVPTSARRDGVASQRVVTAGAHGGVCARATAPVRTSITRDQALISASVVRRELWGCRMFGKPNRARHPLQRRSAELRLAPTRSALPGASRDRCGSGKTALERIIGFFGERVFGPHKRDLSSTISAPWTRSRSESASDRCVHSAAPSTSWSLLRRDSSSASKSTGSRRSRVRRIGSCRRMTPQSRDESMLGEPGHQ